MQNPTDVEFDEVSMWVQFHNVPIACMDTSIIKRLGERVGRVEEVEIGEGGVSLGRIAKARISRRVDQPLVRCVPLADDETEREVLIILQYEKLPEFCFACGRLGHISKDCDDGSVDKTNFQFNEWLRAGVLVGRQAGGRRRWGEGASIQNNDTKQNHAPQMDVERCSEERLLKEKKNDAEKGIDKGAGKEMVLVNEEGEEDLMDFITDLTQKGSLVKGKGESSDIVNMLEERGANRTAKVKGDGVNEGGEREQDKENEMRLFESPSKNLSPKKMRSARVGKTWKKRGRELVSPEGKSDGHVEIGVSERGGKKRGLQMGDELVYEVPPTKVQRFEAVEEYDSHETAEPAEQARRALWIVSSRMLVGWGAHEHSMNSGSSWPVSPQVLFSSVKQDLI